MEQPTPVTTMSKAEKAAITSTVTPVTLSSKSSYSNSSGDPEKQDDYDSYELPEKEGYSALRNLRWQIMTVYRRLFTLVFFGNLICLIVFAVIGISTAAISAAATGTLMIAIGFRNDHVVNTLYRITCHVSRKLPLVVRRKLAKIYYFGGMHSGFASASVSWLVFLLVRLMISLVNNAHAQGVTVAAAVLTFPLTLMLGTCVIFAYPELRNRFHNVFERTHRFAGWTALALVWALVVCAAADSKASDQSLGDVLKKDTSFWFLMPISFCIIYPWLHLRKVEVRTEKLSSHAIRIWVKDRPYVGVPTGSFIRVSLNPLFEWHSFAAVREPEGWSMIISKAGDWTSKVIADPPTHLWVRGLPTSGVLHVAKLFHKVVIIGTGSGIGPCLSVMLKGDSECRVLWSTRTPVATYGQHVVDQIYGVDPNALVWDTNKNGKPDLVKLAYGLYQESGAEAVIMIANPKATYKTVYGLLSRGVPAYGAVWDS